MKRYSSEELQELAAGYALGAASAEESAAVERAMAESPELAAEVASFRDVAVRLAQQRAVAPSADVRTRLLARVRETPQGAAPPGAQRREATVTPISQAPSVRRARSTPWLAAGLAASLLVAAGLAWQNVELRRSLDERRSELAAATEKATRRDRQLETVLEAEKDLYVAQMKGTDTVTGPGIQFFWNEKKQVAMLHAFRLKPAPTGRAYQLWLIRDGKPVSAKVFNSDADGHALVENIEVPTNAAGVTQVLLTEEPASGSPLPTTKPFLGGALAKT